MKAKLSPKCNKCGEADPVKFNKSGNAKSGYQSWCKACINEYQRTHRRREDTPERKEMKRRYQQEHKAQQNERQKAYSKRTRRIAAEYQGLVNLLRQGEIEKAVKMAEKAEV